MAPGKLPTSDWRFMGWHYKAIHSIGPLHNRALRVRAQGLDRLPAAGPALLAANHASYWDGILMQAALPRPVNILVRHELLASRFGNWFFGRGGAIPVERNARRNPHAFDAALQALADDRIIGIYPEGARLDHSLTPYVSAGGMPLRKPKVGVARLALQARAPVVPMAILTDRFWPRERKVPNFREPVYLNVGEPVHYEGDPADRALTRKIADDVMHRVAGLIEEAVEARDAGAKWGAP